MKNNSNSIVRSIIIDQEKINYNLRYSKKARYLRIQISGDNELELIVPRGYQIKEAESFLITKAGWIRKHLKNNQEITNGFLLFGNEIQVLQSYQLFIKRHKLFFKNNILSITSPEGSSESTDKIYEVWLKHISKNYIINRTQSLANKFGFSINRITIRSQKTRWGSASTKGNLSFNYKLMKYRKDIIDYVIIHELCHLKEMNHSKKFWKLVERYCPSYKALRLELKRKN